MAIKSISSIWAKGIILLKIIVVVVFCEAIIMWLLSIFQLPNQWDIFIDPILLAIFITPILYIVAIRPISSALLKSVASEKALKESEKRHKTIIQTAIDGFWVYNPRQSGR